MMDRRRFIDLMGGAGILAWASKNCHASNPHLAGASAARELDATQSLSTPLAIHPDNPKYFLFRGKPLVLVAATEHYGSVINRRFDFSLYLREAAAKRQTVTRLFLLFR